MEFEIKATEYRETSATKGGVGAGSPGQTGRNQTAAKHPGRNAACRKPRRGSDCESGPRGGCGLPGQEDPVRATGRGACGGPGRGREGAERRCWRPAAGSTCEAGRRAWVPSGGRGPERGWAGTSEPGLVRGEWAWARGIWLRGDTQGKGWHERGRGAKSQVPRRAPVRRPNADHGF